MCLFKTHWFPKIALEPITVYKVFKVYHGELISPYRDFKYKIGKTYYSKISPVLGVIKKTIEPEGIHSHDNSYIAFFARDHDEVVAECTIPRFSLYYIGLFSDIASGRIIINKIIE